MSSNLRPEEYNAIIDVLKLKIESLIDDMRKLSKDMIFELDEGLEYQSKSDECSAITTPYIEKMRTMISDLDKKIPMGVGAKKHKFKKKSKKKRKSKKKSRRKSNK
jgi:hypothetical protein